MCWKNKNGGNFGGISSVALTLDNHNPKVDSVINLFCRKAIRGRTNAAYVFFATLANALTHRICMRQKKVDLKLKNIINFEFINTP